jgi:hypothetical protein
MKLFRSSITQTFRPPDGADRQNGKWSLSRLQFCKIREAQKHAQNSFVGDGDKAFFENWRLLKTGLWSGIAFACGTTGREIESKQCIW